MTPTKNKFGDGKKQSAQSVFHLIHATSDGKPLCGETSPDALIGSYSEHLDGTASENVRWVREIFDSNGKAVAPCPVCLSFYPPVLIDLVPFDITINVHFKPNKPFSGYNVITSSSATVGTECKQVSASPALTFFSARWLGDLKFSVDLDVNPIVPFVEQANKTK